jgi:predicted MPP superfamily phosphohydrolase
LRARIAVFLVIIQSILFLTHWFIYATWTAFRAQPDPPGITPLQATVALLSVSFLTASLLAYRLTDPIVRNFYRIAALWLGAVNFLFLATCLLWILYFGATIAHLQRDWPRWAAILFAAALIAALVGAINARVIRIRKIKIALPNLPSAWRGRVAALVSDVHLGHVNGPRFLDRVVKRLQGLKPDIVFIPGDLYDGTAINSASAARPLQKLTPPLGAFFVTGNHEEFRDPSHYLEAVRATGVRVLENESLLVDGLQIVGVPDHASANANRFQSTLKHLSIDRSRPSILLSHAPRALSIPEQAGISLQLSGHTHGGQIFPFTWFTRKIFHDFTKGLHRHGNLQVFTTTGVGTWGPPLRLGTNPEIVLIEFREQETNQ